MATSSLGQTITYKIEGHNKSDQIILESLFRTNDSINLNIKKLSNIKERLNHEGYFNYTIKEKSFNDTITNIEIKLNDIIKIIKVPKEAIPEAAYELLNLTYLKIQKDFILIDIKQFKNFIGELNNFYSSNGFPFNYVQLKPYYNIKDTVYSNLEIKTNDLRLINHIIIKGYKKFPKNYIKNYKLK